MKLASILACTLLYVLIFLQNAHALPKSMFRMSEIFSNNKTSFLKWNDVETRSNMQANFPKEKCDGINFHPCHIKDLSGLTKAWRGLAEGKKLEAINAYANEHAYIIDQINWGVDDFWATPYEFAVKNGDCEDYAIAKYHFLRASGLSADRMRIIIVQDFNLGGVIHAVLGVYDSKNNLYILDNQIKQVVSADSIYHYKPIYGINEHGWWAYTPDISGGA